ncbi:TetR/AcrR family transcriptional regulator [Nocardia sp. NPDC050175]|uniref:TetR/AcrR family transcriptional regulator n=1 Tax=Nocardia sp. NPDC050175 TaxID=3364317 RepID=UPI0037B9E164
MTSTDKPRTRRRRDPEQRRDEVITAAEEVITERGLAALTHRAVAEKSGVTLGSTTYYFKTLDDIVVAALQRAVDRFTTYVTEFHDRSGFADIEELIPALADELVTSYTEHRNRTAMEFELYTAAMRDAALRPIAEQQMQVSTATFARYTDQLTAETAAAFVSGLTVRAMTATTPPSREQVIAMLERVLLPTRSSHT